MAEEKKEEVELTEVVTQTAQAVKLPDGTIVDGLGLQVWMANQLINLRKAVG